MRALWDSTFFDDIEVDLTRSDRGVALRFLVRERAEHQVDREYDNNEEIDDDKLNESVELKPNTILSVPAVRRSVQKIKDAYAEKGFFLADCEFVIEPQRDNEVVVRFKIKEHQPSPSAASPSSGITRFPTRSCATRCRPAPAVSSASAPAGRYRQDVFERDILLLNALYYDKGFMNVQIGTPRVMLTPDREGIDITVARSTRDLATRSGNCACTSATPTGTRSSRSAVARRSACSSAPRPATTSIAPS